MKVIIRCTLITILTLATPLAAYADTSMLRIMCSGEDIGAEVTVNNKFKGECPIDVQVTPGKLKLQVVKSVDELNEKFYEKEIRIGDGVVQRVNVELSTRMSAQGLRLEAKRIAAEAAEIKRAAKAAKTAEAERAANAAKELREAKAAEASVEANRLLREQQERKRLVALAKAQRRN